MLFLTSVLYSNGFASVLKVRNDKSLFYKNRRAKYPLGVNLIAAGPSEFLALSFDWFITPKLNLEIGGGANHYKNPYPNYFVGLKYHFFGKTISNLTLYAGGFGKNDFDFLEKEIVQELYFPIGLQKIKKSKLTWNIEVAYRYNLITSQSRVWGAFKLGYRFNRPKKKKIK